MDGTARAKIRNVRHLRALIVALAIVALGSGCGDDEEVTTTTTSAPRTPTEPATPPDDSGAPADTDAGERGGPRPQPRSEEAEVARAVRAYVRALDDRNGERVCSLLAPGAIDEVDLPRDRGGCSDSLSASIGYRDPRGLPVWRAARVGEIVSADVGGSTAKVIATTITLFADREEPSIEDDVVYLVRRGGRWLIAKPSATLYRAVGIADIPPAVLAPP